MRLEESVQNPCMVAASIWLFGQHSSVLFGRKNWCPCPWDPDIRSFDKNFWAEKYRHHTMGITLKQCTTHSQHQLFGPVDHTRIVFWTDAPQFYVRNARGIGIENLSPKKLNLCTLAEMKLYKKPCQCHNFSDHSWFKHSWFRIHQVISLIHRMKGQNMKY